MALSELFEIDILEKIDYLILMSSIKHHQFYNLPLFMVFEENEFDQ